MTITIRLKTDNDAFAGENRQPELQRILQHWLQRGFPGDHNLYDSYGNKVGTVTVKGK